MKYLALIAFIFGNCPKQARPIASPAADKAMVFDAVRDREVPDPVRARFNIKLRSKPMKIAVNTTGGLVIDRPGQAYIALLTPLGQPAFTVTSDGTDVGVANRSDRLWVRVDEANDELAKETDGAISLDDIVGLLVGAVPLHATTLKSRRKDDAGVRLVLGGPGGTHIETVVDTALHTPVSLWVDDKDGKRVVSAEYGSFQRVGELLVPSRVKLDIAPGELSMDLKFRSWKQIDEVPDVFGVNAPEGYESVPLAEYVKRVKAAVDESEESATTDQSE